MGGDGYGQCGETLIETGVEMAVDWSGIFGSGNIGMCKNCKNLYSFCCFNTILTGN